MLEALRREIILRQDYLGGAEVTTVYLGGGTPSLLHEDELNGLMDVIGKHYRLSPDCEITLEANPDDLDREKVAELRRTALNRLSIGIQSFFDEDLKWMNRAHNASQALDSIRRVQDAGYENLTADLIYGYGMLTDRKWLHNIHAFLKLGIPHLSCYNLTVEPGTALSSFIARGWEEAPEDDQGAVQFELLMSEMEKEGFLHYEISNFCRDGFYSRHNTAYWQEEPYLGIGPSAHSYNGRRRSWNIGNNHQYVQAISRKELPSEEETLSLYNRVNERIMTGLRTMWGLSLQKIEKDFGKDVLRLLCESAVVYKQKGWIRERDGRFVLSSEGKLYADRIASDLFLAETS